MSKIATDKLFQEKFLEDENKSRNLKSDHWKNFEQMLDKTMPVEKKNNFGFYFNILILDLSSLIILGAISLFLSYSNGSNATSFNAKSTISVNHNINLSQRITSTAKTDTRNLNENSLTSIPSVQTNNVIAKNETKPQEPVSKNNNAQNEANDNHQEDNLSQVLPASSESNQNVGAETASNTVSPAETNLVPQKEMKTVANTSTNLSKQKAENKIPAANDSIKKPSPGKKRSKKFPDPHINAKGF